MAQATFQIAASGDDSNVYRVEATNYPPGGSPIWQPTATNGWVGRSWDGSNYYIINGLLRFDTSSLPDVATITGATLRLYITSDRPNFNSRSITADYYGWDGVSNTDHSDLAQTGALTSFPISSLTINTTNDIPLDDVSGISKTGYTSLRLHCSGGIPTGNNYIVYPLYDDGTNFALRPQLVVTYSLPHAGYDIAVDETTTNPSRVLNAAPATTDYGLVLRRETLDQGQTQCHFYSQAVAAANNTEVAVSLTPVRGFVQTAAATTHTVTSGKTMRITAIYGNTWRSTGTNSATTQIKLQLRVNTSGTATTSSPIAWSGTWAWGELVAASTTVNFGSQAMFFDIPEGIELPSGASFMLTVNDVATTTNSRHTNEISMNAYEV